MTPDSHPRIAFHNAPQPIGPPLATLQFASDHPALLPFCTIYLKR